MIIALIVFGCTAPIATVDTNVPAPTDTDNGSTGDTSAPDSASDTAGSHHWTGVRGGGEGRWAAIAIQSVDPLVVAYVDAGYWDGNDWFRDASVVAAPFESSLDSETYHTTASAPFLVLYSQPISVASVGDVTGDGLSNVAAAMQTDLPLIPVDPNDPDFQLLEWDDVVQGWAPGGDIAACDADQDGQPDLCTALGVDRGPIDGIPDTTWPTDFPDALDRQHLAIGRTPSTVAWIPTQAGIAQLDLTQTGTLDPSSAPTWNAPAGHTITALAPIDPDGDGLDALLVCSEPDNAVRLLDAFPADAAPFLTLDAPCDALEVADFDGDGQLELAVGADSRVRIHELDGTLLAEHIGVYSPGEDGLGKSMDSADIDGDGRADLLVAAPDHGALYLTLNAVP
jgi:hypothetical protein